MNGDGGWIKIHRSIFKNPWMRNVNVLGTWVYILLNVAYQPEDVVFEGKRITLQPGQGLFKMRQVAKELGISVTTLHRITEVFKSEKQIETQTSPRNTLITVVNWSKYQMVGTQNGTQTEHKRNTNGTQNDSLPIERNKEEKNKRIYRERHKHGTYQNVLLSDEDLQKLQTEFPGDWQRRIERLSEYMASTGKSYKDHLATIRAWARKDAERNRPIAKNDAASGYARMMEILGGKSDD